MADDTKKILTDGLPGVKFAEPMASHATFNIGGPADYFYEAKTVRDFVNAIKLAKKVGLPYFILGGGSNVLFSDAGYRGIVIRNDTSGLKVKGNTIVVEAGVVLGKVVAEAARNGLTGLEFAAGIPGTVGGAIFGNAGAWQKSIGEVILQVTVLDSKNQVKVIDRDDCDFSYRQSRFKSTGEVILSAELSLALADVGKIREEIESNLAKRVSQPKEPSAGSVFVNPKPDSAGRLIEAAGLKGKTIGGAMFSPLHANFIVNTGGAKARDVVELINLAKETVENKFSIKLNEEICLVGFDKIKK